MISFGNLHMHWGASIKTVIYIDIYLYIYIYIYLYVCTYTYAMSQIVYAYCLCSLVCCFCFLDHHNGRVVNYLQTNLNKSGRSSF